MWLQCGSSESSPDSSCCQPSLGHAVLVDLVLAVTAVLLIFRKFNASLLPDSSRGLDLGCVGQSVGLELPINQTLKLRCPSLLAFCRKFRFLEIPWISLKFLGEDEFPHLPTLSAPVMTGAPVYGYGGLQSQVASIHFDSLRFPSIPLDSSLLLLRFSSILMACWNLPRYSFDSQGCPLDSVSKPCSKLPRNPSNLFETPGCHQSPNLHGMTPMWVIAAVLHV